VERQRFLFFPSTYHPAPEYIRPEFHPLLTAPEAAPPPGGRIRLSIWAEAVEARPVETGALARALAAHTIYTPEYAAERFALQKDRTLQLVTLRVYRLPEARVVPMRAEYRGCTSWVDLAEPIDTAGSVPALDDAAFARATAAIAATLRAPVG
jgi:hypothetical protein